MKIKTIIFTFLAFNHFCMQAIGDSSLESKEIHASAEQAMQKGNFAIAYCLWEPLANQGDSKAQFNIGWMFHNGYGLAINDETAFNWWLKSAEQGNNEAFYSLADLFLAGFGVEKNIDIAMGWYIAAAERGHQGSLEIIHELKQRDDDVSQFYLNKLIENNWFLKMAEKGDPLSLKTITALAKDKKYHVYLEKALKEKWPLFQDKYSIKVTKANIRKGPGTGFPIITSLTQGQELTILSKQGNWSQIGVKNSGDIAWIFTKLIEPSVINQSEL